MKTEEFKEKIKILIKQVYKNRKVSDLEAVKYDELTKFPELDLSSLLLEYRQDKI